MDRGEATWPPHLIPGQWRQGGGGVEGGEATWPPHLLPGQWIQGGGGVEGGEASWPPHLLPSQQCIFWRSNVFAWSTMVFLVCIEWHTSLWLLCMLSFLLHTSAGLDLFFCVFAVELCEKA